MWQWVGRVSCRTVFLFLNLSPRTCEVAHSPAQPSPPHTMTTSMILRDGSIVGGARGRLPPAAAQTFTAAVRTVLTRWTALRLAVEGGWGGPDSDSKAGTMVDDVVGWFRDGTGEN